MRHLTGGFPVTAVATTLAAAAFLACEGPSSTTPLAGPEALSLSASSLYSVAHAGDVDTDPNPARGRPSGKLGLEIGRNHGQESFILRKGFADALDPTGTCFTRDAAGDFISTQADNNGFMGQIHRERRNDSRVEANYYFIALGTDGATSFNYRLMLGGSVPAGTYPPDPSFSTTVTWDTATMITEGRGKGSKGGNEGAACVGEVAISGGVTVTGVE